MTESKFDNLNSFDEKQRYCPRLGGPIRFSFCRMAGDEKEPCYKVFDCWFEHFDVVGYFRQCLSKEAFQDLACHRPPNKVTSLVGLIHQARQRLQDKEQ